MSYELAKAYVQIVPTTKNFKSQLTSAIGSDITTAGTSAGSNFGTAFGSKLTSVIASLGIAAMVEKAFSAIVDAGTEFETSFAKVQTIMDQTQVSSDDMSEAILDLSSEMGVAASDIADTVYSAISATGDTANAVELVSQASALATAGFTDTDSALSALTTAMNAYGLSADQAEAISDSLIQTQNLGVTTVDELASSMGKAISTASAYSVDLSNLETAYVSLTKAGISTEESTTYLSSMLNELGDTGSDVAAVLQEETGQSFTELMESGSSLGDVMSILYEACDEDSTALMNLWSSAEAGKASNAIVSQGLEEFNENLETIANSAGTTEEAYATMAETLEYQTSVLQTAGQNLLIAFYDGMEGQLAQIVGFGADAVSQLTTAFEEGGITGMAAAAPAIISEAVLGFLNAMPEIISTGQQTIAAFLTGFGEQLPTLIPAAIEAIGTIVTTLVENIPMMIEAGLSVIGGLAEGILTAIPNLIEALPEVISSILSYITENLPSILAEGVEIINSLVTGILEAIPALLEALPQIISSFTDYISQNLPEIVSAGADIIANLIVGIIEAIPDIVAALPDIISAIAEGIIELLPSIVEAGKEIVSGIIEGIREGLPDIGEAISGLGESILEGFKNFFGISSPSTVMEEQGGYMVEGLINGVSGMPADLGTCLSEALSNVTGWGSDLASSALSAGSNMLGNVTKYVTQLPSKMSTQLKSTLSKVTNFSSDSSSKMATAGSGMVSKLTSNLSGISSKVYDKLKTVNTRTSSWGTSLGASFKSIGKNLVYGLWNGISDKISWVVEKIKGMGSSIISAVKSVFGISSPSKVFAEIGEYLAQGLGNGFESDIGDVSNMVTQMMQSLTNRISALSAEAAMTMPDSIDANVSQAMQQSVTWTRSAAKTETGASASGGYTQNITINSPKSLSPSETARQTRNATRNMVLALKGV